MLRSILLIVENEFRLLAADRAAIFMLLLAPIVIITVAGLSLGNLYGVKLTKEPYVIAVIDQDRGEVGESLIDALQRARSIKTIELPDSADARALMMRDDRAPLAIVIPRGTTESFKAGNPVKIEVLVDPVKRIEASAIELRLGELCAALNAAASDRARRELARQAAEVRQRLGDADRERREFAARLVGFRREVENSRSAARVEIAAQTKRELDEIQVQTESAIDDALSRTKTAAGQDLAKRRDALAAVQRYLDALATSQHDFENWFATLKSIAGSQAGRIPPPPNWPAPPTPEQVATLTAPIAPSTIAAPTIPPIDPHAIAFSLPPMPKLPEIPAAAGEPDDSIVAVPTLPGNLGWRERPLRGAIADVNTFDQYVPGFGITFLLVDMLWGVAVGLIDEREWGTLLRLRVSGASLPGMMIGKLTSRFLLGLVQMIALLAVGAALFGVYLGRNPLMLLVPAAAISFAAAAFSLVIAGIAPSRDAVLPIGVMMAMAMSAVGGCWWPLDFEPRWIRAAAWWMPTTWTMRAFNDLMIRELAPSSALRPAAMTIALGLVYLAIGLLTAPKLYQQRSG